MTTTFDTTGLAQVAGTVTVYSYDNKTGEYIGETDEYVAVGVGIPAHSTVTPPPVASSGYVAVFSSGTWQTVADHRGEIVYSTVDGAAVDITAPGDYPANTTTLKPATPYDQWAGDMWVTDIAAQKSAQVAAAEAHRQYLIAQANDYINTKQWPGKAAIGRLKTDELAKYNLWLDYLDALEAVDTSAAPDITWPVAPNA
ncbi:TPA: tail fiber assembly protein [Citrobacter freundii]|uniref:tail fiber assembly protein n=1 Tax=Citrobacter freundii TaxID=546 RepID=UPI0015E90743|nr:tail fiber assembly protein [Citrobacter freundii]QLV75574.1 tail fiber assembly protein [Citrobacter freundii]